MNFELSEGIIWASILILVLPSIAVKTISSPASPVPSRWRKYEYEMRCFRVEIGIISQPQNDAIDFEKSSMRRIYRTTHFELWVKMKKKWWSEDEIDSVEVFRVECAGGKS